MTYAQTVNWMYQQLPMFQRQGKTAFKAKLDNTIALAAHLGNPENKFRSVHVAGTNGKGSTSHMIASVLQEAGYRVGLYTSPHLKDFRERIKINGAEVSEDFVVQFVADNKTFFETHQLSFFEMTVGMAFDYFAQEKVDVAVVEVGLGGRLDSTNIIHPEVSVITNIGLDHTDILGNTIKEIAFEKAGIIKREVPVVIGEFQEESFPVFGLLADERNAPLYKAWELTEIYETDLLGSYQQMNVKTAVTALKCLAGFHILDTHIKTGLLHVVRNTGLKGRWQQLNSKPKVLCDTGHNQEGLALVMQQLKKETYQQLHMVIGVVKDKDLKRVLPLFPKHARYYFCKPDLPRGLDAAVLCEEASHYELSGKPYASVQKAYQTALKHAGDEDLIFVGGSTFVVAEVL